MDSRPLQPDPPLKRPLVWRLCGEFKRLAVLTALAAAVFVAGKYYLVDRLNEEIRLRVESQLTEHYRGLGVSIDSARRIAGEGIELSGVEIRDGQAADAPLLVHIDEVFVECDTRLPEFVTQTPQIVQMQFRRLKLRAQRQPDGSWNLSKLLPLPGASDGGGPAPSATIRDGSLEIVDPTTDETTPLALRNIELVVKPVASGHKLAEDGSAGASPSQASPSRAPTDASPPLLHIKGSLAGDHLERVELDGLLDPASAAWHVRGAIEGLEFNPRLRTALPRELARLIEPLSTVRGRTYLGFDVKRPSRTVALEFVVSGKISEGRIDDARLPEPLTDVEATIRADNHGLVIQDLSARCGRTQLSIDAELFGWRPNSPLQLDIEAKQLELERVPVRSLPTAARKVYDDFSPAGLVDLSGHLRFDGREWRPDLTFTCHDLSVLYDRFKYRLTAGSGTIELKNDRLNMRLRLVAGGQFIQVRSDVLHPGPNFTGWVEVQSEGPLPVDGKLLDALDAKAQRIVRAFHPQGNISFQGRLQRGEHDRELHRQLHIGLHDCSVSHDKFRYPIDKVNGSLQLTGNDWIFRNLTGRNDSAYITGSGSWQSQPADGNHLTLDFKATDVPLADELRQALAPGAQRLWANLRPRGNIDHLAVGIKYDASAGRLSVDVRGDKWPPGQNIEGRQLSIEPTWLKYRMDNLTGSIHYRDGLMELTSLAASHGKTTIEADGWARVLDGGGCRLELTRLAADRLEADHELTSALPPTIGHGLSRLAIQGPINVQGTLGVTVPGHADLAPEINWDLSCVMAGGRLATPTPIEHVHGGVRLIGQSGPEGAITRGELAIDSAVIRDVQLTQINGPLLIDTQRVIFGSAAERDVQGRAPRPISASLCEGQLSIDGQMRLSEAGEFAAQATLENADLAAVAKELAPRQRGLIGKVFGTVNITGTLQGVHTWRGSGQVRLRDADIYELPVMIAMLSLLRVQRPDRTAFTTSNIDFRVEGDDLALDRLDFNGDILCLKGKGRITGQREVDLKFYPQFGRDEMHLPLFRPFVGEASRQFLLVEVTGTLDKQNVTRTVFPRIDERLAELFPELAREPEDRNAPVPLLDMPRQALERTGLLPKQQ